MKRERVDDLLEAALKNADQLHRKMNSKTESAVKRARALWQQQKSSFNLEEKTTRLESKIVSIRKNGGNYVSQLKDTAVDAVERLIH